MKMIAIGSDHAGFALKQEIMAYLREKGVEFTDYGTFTDDSVNYAPIAKRVCDAVNENKAEKGILVCGTGIGMSMAANKVKGIRAAVCTDHFSCKFTRLHNDANVLCLGGRVVGAGIALELVDIFLSTPFEGGKHKVRIDQIADIENGVPIE